VSFPRYPAYKPSGVEWLGEVPEDWEAVRLRFVATLNPSKQEARELGNREVVSFLPMEAIGEDGNLRLEQEKEIGECLSGYTYFRDGDVCIAKITPCFENGKGAILRELKGGIGFGTTELIVVRPDNEKITSEFLDYIFRSQTFRRLGESEMYGAGGQKRVPDSFVSDFMAILPSIKEQSQISSFLNRETAKIDALIAEQQRLIELLEEKRQAVISHAVTTGLNPDAPMKDSGVEWLGEVPEHWAALRLRFLATLNPSKQEAKELGDHELVSFLPMEAIGEDGSLKLEQEREVCECLTGYTYFRNSDVCVAKITPCFENGKGAILRGLKGGIGFGTTELIVARPDNEKITSEFLDYLFRSLTFRRLGESEMYGAGGQKRVPDSFVRDFTAALPSIMEQRQVTTFLDLETAKMDALITEQQVAITLLQERRSALISAAVTGQIDVRGLVPEAEAA